MRQLIAGLLLMVITGLIVGVIIALVHFFHTRGYTVLKIIIGAIIVLGVAYGLGWMMELQIHE